MQTQQLVSRRNFIGTTALTAGFAALGTETTLGQSSEISKPLGRLPREVWIASLSQHGMSANTSKEMVQKFIELLEQTKEFRPDIICLPEFCMTSYVRERKPLAETADMSAELLEEFAAFALTNQCYLICPIYMKDEGKIYNVAVVIDRQGNRLGEYRKMFLPDEEVEMGLTPGPLHPPVFKTDFGIIGIQICFDINWNAGWEALRQQGAEIIFWPSAFAGGLMVNAKAWQNKAVVVSSTRNQTTKICEITGDVIAQTGPWNRNLVCAPVNLEKAFIHTWPYGRRYGEIRAKYGRKIRIFEEYDEEGWSIIESRSSDVRVKDILTEFEIPTYEQLLQNSEKVNVKLRG